MITVDINTRAVQAATSQVEDAAQILPAGRVWDALGAAAEAIPGSRSATALVNVASTLDAELAETRDAWRAWSDGGRDAIVAYAAADAAAEHGLASASRGTSVAL